MTILLAPAAALALDPDRHFTQYQRAFWTNLNGLPQRSVHALAQTADGYLWFGTQEGLARFDGVRFTVFDKTNAPQFPGFSIVDLAATPDGALWGITRNGLFRISDGRAERIPTRDTPCAAAPTALWADAENGLWVGDENGAVCAFRHSRWEPPQSTPAGSIRVIRRTAAGVLWVGGAAGLSRFHRTWRHFTPADGLPAPSVRAILARRDGSLLIGTARGLAVVDGDRIRPWGSAAPAFRSVIGNLLEDRDGNLWIANWPAGVWRLTPSGDLAALDPANSIQAGIETLLEDREGGLWIGSASDGAMVLHAPRINPYGAAEGVSDRTAWSVLAGRNDEIWITTRFDGLRRLDRRRRPLPVPAPLLARRTGALLETARGDLWIGIVNGIARLDGARVRQYFYSDNPEGRVVVALAEAEHGGLWVATADRGLLAFRDGEFTPVARFARRGIKSMFRDSSGALWVSDLAGEFSVLRNGEWSSVPGLPRGSPVLSMLEDHRGSLWVSTEGNGIRRIRGNPGHLVGTAQGLCSDVNYWMVDDRKGHFWFSTSRGIARVSADDLDAVSSGRAPRLTCALFHLPDGMRNPEGTGGVGPGAGLDRDGRLWFATTAGVVSVNPVHSNREAPLSEPILEMAEYQPGQVLPPTLPSGLRDVQFRFTVPRFHNPNLLQLRYRLAGYDNHWIDGAQRAARYTNLPPGSYRFEVQAAGPHGAWSDPVVLSRFSIPRLFHETAWFLLLGALLLAALVAAGVSFRTRRMHARQKLLEALVDQRTAEARNASRAKSAFLANMSHEIRTPMSATIGTVELLMAMDLPAEAKDHLNTIRASGETLLTLINDILDYSKIEAGKLVLETRPFPLVESIEETLALVAVQAQARGLSLLDDIHPDVPDRIDGDQTRLRQILLNLLSNAIKFTPSGRVHLRVGVEPSPGGPGRLLHFQVADTGIGLSPHSLSRLFQEFTQADDSTTRRFGGTGLGLAISHRLVETFGGRIWAQSVEGAGSTFHFTIPLTGEQHTPTPPLPPHQGPILLLLSDPDAAAALKHRLARLGCDEFLTLSPAAPPPSIVFVDAPGSDTSPFPSLDALRAANPALRLVEVATHPCPRHSASGLSFPLRSPALRQLLGHCEPAPAPVIPTDSLAHRLPLAILVVEDTQVNQHVILRMLQNLGYHADLAENGVRALDALSRRPYDLVFMDIHMPELDGIETTRRALAASPHPNQPVFVALTASAFDENRAECLAAGMSGFLTKPVRTAELAAAIRNVPAWKLSSYRPTSTPNT